MGYIGRRGGWLLTIISKVIKWIICRVQHNNNRERGNKCCTCLFIYLLSFLLTLWSRVFLEKITGVQLVKNPPHIMEQECSLPHSQEPVTCSYPEPDRSSPYPQHPTSSRSILILFSHLRLVLPSDRFPSDFPTKTPYKHLPSSYVLHAPPISLFSNRCFIMLFIR